MFIRKYEYEKMQDEIKSLKEREASWLEILKGMTMDTVIWHFSKFPNGIFLPTKVYNQAVQEYLNYQNENKSLKEEFLKLKAEYEYYRTEYAKCVCSKGE